MTAEQMLDDAQRLAWLRLIRSENVGPVTFRHLINRFGGAERALEALPDLSLRGGRSRPVRVCGVAEAAEELEISRKAGAACVAAGESGYPPRLKHIDDPPPLLHVLGFPDATARPGIAIVGARNASSGGRQIARKLAADLGAEGYVIVSGLARGIDGAAHEGSLETGTLAVLPGGLLEIYPDIHRDLAARIAEHGAVLSETHPHYRPRGRDFPRRNRIVSGICLGVIIVEGARRSGSLITARLALEQGREVFAVPGSPLDPRSEGTNQLIRDGAVLTRNAGDVIEALTNLHEAGDRSASSIDIGEEDYGDTFTHVSDDDRTLVLQALTSVPIEIDIVIQETGLAARIVAAAILELELAGRVHRSTGTRVSLIV
ncbi:MAG: DNA-processing protein DprA [Pseudomonadota bacterium]